MTMHGMTAWMLGSAVLALAAPAPAPATLAPDALATAVAHPLPGARLPGALRFTTAGGQRVSLDDIAAGRPLALIFADYTCRHICSPGIMLSAAALGRTGLAAGRDYRLAIVGLDPQDGAAAARAMTGKLAAAAPRVAGATTMLLGDPAATPAAARALGYGYVHDIAADQFAHDATIYIFSGDGRLKAVLPELGVNPAMLKAALAGPAPAAGLVSRVAHLCYGFAAAHGRYGRAVVLGLQALSAGLILALGLFLWRRRATA